MRATGEKPDPVGPTGMAGNRSDDAEKVDRLKVRPGLAGTGEKPPALPRCDCDAPDSYYGPHREWCALLNGSDEQKP